MDIRRFLVFIVCGLALAGCETLPKSNPSFAPVEPADLTPPYRNTGAIYQAGYDMRLFEDITARRVGDILTVRLVERTDATKEANTDIERDASTSIKVPTFFGGASGKLLGADFETELASKTDFEGETESEQNNQLTGTISVTVVEVLPNGNLKVRGEKRVTLNQGDEYIRLSGIVRPVDIDAANTVSSNQVADATIMYTGQGALNDANRMGWLTRFFTSILFPF